MIGVVYNDIGSTVTVEELAEKHGAFKQSIADSNKSFLRNLWNSSSSELKERYPLNEILTARKPLSQLSRERISSSRGGAILRIKEQVESGITDINSISQNTGISKNTVRNIASRRGINIPRELLSYKQDLEQLNKETDDEKLQELLDQLPYNVIKRRKKKENSQFSSLSPLIKEAGFRSRNNHPFATSLKFAGVPVSIKDVFLKDGRSQRNYIVLSRHKDRIIQVLKEEQSLQRFQR